MKRIVLIGLTVMLMFALWTNRAQNQDVAEVRSLLNIFDKRDSGEISWQDLLAEKYYYLLDEKGREITVTGRRIHVGDEYITADNKLYRVYSVRDRKAYARFIRRIGASYEDGARPFYAALLDRLGLAVLPAGTESEEKGKAKNKALIRAREEEGGLAPRGEPSRIIAIYLTHNAESYVPSDGTHSIFGRGGIHDVGAAFAKALEAKDINVVFDQTKHLPHDRGAYRRSRATAERLLAKGPDVMFDLHRDAAPKHVYAEKIDGNWITQVKFVVGRQNPNMRVNRQLALDLKKTADEIHPGLIKGIFMARGDYNQDLTPMNLLLEAGAHTNSKDAAKDGIDLFADVVSYYFYGNAENARLAQPARPRGEETPAGGDAVRGGRAAWRNIGYLLAAVMTIAAAFLFINAGPVKKIQQKLIPYIRKTEPFTAKTDSFLTTVRENIRKIALSAGAAVISALNSGDKLLMPAAEKINKIPGILASWQKKLGAWVSSVIENRRKLR